MLKCLPLLLYTKQACCLLACNKQLLEFIITRIFGMKIFQTCSHRIVRECQLNFNYVPIQSQITGNIRHLDIGIHLLYLKIVCVHCLHLMLHIN